MSFKYYVLLLLTCLFWAGNFVVSKSLVEHSSPMTLTTLRWIIAVLCLFPLVWWKEKNSAATKCNTSFVFNGINRCCSI